MIYAPPYLIIIYARIISDGNPKSTQDGKHWKASNEQAFYYYEANTSKHQQEGNTIQRTAASHLPSRMVTNKLSGVSVTHDEYRTFRLVQVV